MRHAYGCARIYAAVLLILAMTLSGCAAPVMPADIDLVTTVGGRAANPAPPARSLPPDPMALGSKDAVLTIIEFSDYQCSYCQRFHVEVLPALKKAYIDTGKVQLIFKDYPLSLHREAMPAAVAGRCAAAQGKFWPMNELLFANQGRLEGALYPKLAQTLALDMKAFKLCTQDAGLRVAVERDQKQALDLGIDATPGFLIGRMQGEHLLVQRVGKGFVDFATLSAELDKLLAAPAPK